MAQKKTAKRSNGASSKSESFKRGMEVLRKMGRENLMLNQKALYPDMYEMSVAHLFGDVWGRPGLSLRERQLVTLAANIAMARPSGNHSHYLSAQKLGITVPAAKSRLLRARTELRSRLMRHATKSGNQSPLSRSAAPLNRVAHHRAMRPCLAASA